MECFLNDESLDFEIQTDIVTLLENVKCQNGNELNQEQAFLALASICSTQAAAQDYFCDVGGVQEIMHILSDGSCHLPTCPSAIFCLACAVKDNVRSQNFVLSHDFLTIIHKILSSHETNKKLSMAAAFLIACSVSGNGRGQYLVCETGCLSDVLTLFRMELVSEEACPVRSDNDRT